MDDDVPESLAVLLTLTTMWRQPALTETETDAALDGYVKYLGNVPLAELSAAIDYLVNTQATWRPDVATIRRTVVERRGLFPSLGEAGRVAKEIAHTRAVYAANGSRDNRHIPPTHPVVIAALDAAGVDSPAAFAKAYREAVEAATREIQSQPLNEPVVFKPVRIKEAWNHRPLDLEWRADGWWDPTGTQVHLDQGDRDGMFAELALPAGEETA